MFEAIEAGPFILWTHLLFLLAGIWLSSEFFFRLAERANLSLQALRDNAWWYMIAFLLGGRGVAMVAEYRVYLRDPLRTMILWDGNFSFFGGAIGVAVVLFYATRMARATFLQWLDVLLPATTFGLAFDWLGKFAAGLSYGRPTDLPWGVIYDAINVRYTIPIHPVQLYYAFAYLALTFALLVVRKRARRAGAETLVGIVAAALLIIFFELFRGDFAIPVLMTYVDFFLLLLLFAGLGVFATLELRFSQRIIIAYEATVAVLFAGYLIVRPWLPFASVELRFSQLLAVVALLAIVVYVIVHRQRYPHL